MRGLIRKIHTYLGLINLSILLVFGVTGLRATLSIGDLGMRSLEASRAGHEQGYVVPSHLQADRDIAEDLRLRLNVASGFADVARDPANNLQVIFSTYNGPRKVTVLEELQRIRIETTTNDVFFFLNNLHASPGRNARDWRLRLWGYYNELSIWSLSAMALTGVFLWLTSRPRLTWAWTTFVGTSALFVLLYSLMR